MSLGTIVAVDFFIRVICRILSSHHQCSARRDSIRQSDVQIGMTIVRYQIHCLVSKHDAVIIVIEDDCHATMFQRRSAQERFAHVHHVKRDLDQDSFSTVRHHVPIHNFLSVVLQCHVVCCHSFNVSRTYHWKLRCKPGWADMSKTSRIDHQLVLLSFPIHSLIFPIHRVPTFLTVFQRKYPESIIGVDVFDVQVSSTCLLLSLSLISVTLDFDFPVPSPLP